MAKTKKYSLNNSYFKSRQKDMPDTILEIAKYEKEHGELPFEHKAAGYALAYAKDLCVAGKIETDKVIPLADKFYNWLLSKKVSE